MIIYNFFMDLYKVIGLMSGTSLDGVDLAYCLFEKVDSGWNFSVPLAVTYAYPDEWKRIFESLPCSSGCELTETDVKYGNYLGSLVNRFIEQYNLKPDFISSHGHTIFHRPDKGYTLQIGNGASIAARTGETVICDFRATDVALLGQGAPLVPAGDKILFGKFGYCLNLGGFANISYDQDNKRIAFDICPVNIVLNRLSMQLGFPFDKDGDNSSKGMIDNDLLTNLNRIDYYHSAPPKSLGREWFENVFLPVLDHSNADIYSKLRTVTEHIAFQISTSTMNGNGHDILITGGGAHNLFLIGRIKSLVQKKLCIPDDKTIDFKEALVFAFLGVLRSRNEINCLASVTGATRDSICGTIYAGDSLK